MRLSYRKEICSVLLWYCDSILCSADCVKQVGMTSSSPVTLSYTIVNGTPYTLQVNQIAGSSSRPVPGGLVIGAGRVAFMSVPPSSAQMTGTFYGGKEQPVTVNIDGRMQGGLRSGTIQQSFQIAPGDDQYGQDVPFAVMITFNYIPANPASSSLTPGIAAAQVSSLPLPRSMSGRALTGTSSNHSSYPFTPAAASAQASSLSLPRSMSGQVLSGGSDTPLADLYARMHLFM
jgi:hypothetical protein